MTFCPSEVTLSAFSYCPRALPAPKEITHGTGERNAAVLLLHATLLGLPRALCGQGLLRAGSPRARPVLSCALLLLQDAPSVQDAARTQPGHQRDLWLHKSQLSAEQKCWWKTKVESSPGGQGPAEHLAAVLHYVAMAVGVLHAVLPSPGPLNLK